MSGSESARRPRSAESSRRRILQAFRERAIQVGPRSVVLSELAQDLGISKRTLYELFTSKEALLQAVLEELLEAMQQQADWHRDAADPPLRQIERYASYWAHHLGGISPAFWHDLWRDYPDLRDDFQARVRRITLQTMAHTRRLMRSDVNPEIAFELFRRCTTMARDPELLRRLGVDRETLARDALTVWVRGVIADPEAPVSPENSAARR